MREYSLLFACLALLPNVIISAVFGLDMHWKAILAVIRCVVQLTLLGYIFGFLFSSTGPTQQWITAAWACFMVSFASFEASNRVKRKYPRMGTHFFLAFFISSLPLAFYASYLSNHPMASPRAFIPFLGMLLSNTLNALTLGTERLLCELVEKRTMVELDFAMGATYWGAMLPIIRNSLSIALLPMVNALSVCGMVAIPGMMTGQLLAGGLPSLAASYQAMIMILIASSQAIGVTLMFLAITCSLKGPFGLILWSRVKPNTSFESSTRNALQSVFTKWKHCAMALRCTHCLCFRWRRRMNLSGYRSLQAEASPRYRL